MAKDKDERIKEIIKQEPVRRVPKTDPNALDKIKKRTGK